VDVIILEPSASDEGAQGRTTYTCIIMEYLLCLIYHDSVCDMSDKVLVLFDTYDL